MQNSEVDSMKHAQLFCHRIQDHKNAVQDTLEGNNSFVTIKVPIHGLYNEGPCGAFNKGNNYSSKMNVMDYDIPELVVFIQEDADQFIDDRRFDNRMLLEGKCLSEDCEFHHNIIPCFFDPNTKRRNGSNIQTTEILSKNSNGSECASQNHSIKNAMKKYDCGNLMMEADVELDSRDNVSTRHATKKITSQRPTEFFREESDISRSTTNWQINSSLGSCSSRVEFVQCPQHPQVSDSTNMSDPMPYIGHATTSRHVSHPSNDSTSSTNSFAFPMQIPLYEFFYKR
ncbi:unnamed protein product [Lupinus luteus]|uniref:Uncharacterized protein n=1 Tax=Lupinus luteus TaxID=3873 RepID=A0AAV1Y164_LUPLU